MKQLILFSAALCLSVSVFAQTQGVFFSEFGENFILYVNGQQQNQAAASNVKVENLTQEFVQIRVDFPEMPGQGFASNVGFEPGSETTYIIKKNRKGEYVARLHNIAPLGGATAAAPAPQATPQPAVQAAPAPAPASQPATIQVDTRMPAEQTTTITTTTTTKPTSRDGVGINMQVPGGGINIQVDGMDMDMTIEETTTIKTTTTTTTTTAPAPQAAPAPQPEPIRRPAIPGYNGRIGCDWPIDDSGIRQMRSTIESSSFEDSKMTVAKQATRSKCMTAAQIKQIMGLFTFEESKLDYAKFAYDYCYDVDNYYILNDAFTFSSSIDELNDFIEGR
ncbi:MAG: DUF4476 domain-containing protein [Flavobacteriales bacterium]